MELSCFYIYLIICFIDGQANELTVSDLKKIKTIQNMYCIPKEACSIQAGVTEYPLPQSESTTTSASEMFVKLISNIPASPPEQPSQTCCEECSCNIDDCYISGSCCIEALEVLWYNNDSNAMMSCDYPQLRPYNTELIYPNNHPPALMFRECSRFSKADLESVDKCEQSDKYDDIETKIPVTDNTTMFIYKNRFCAICNNITENSLHYWDVTLECSRGLLKPRTFASIVTEVLESESCNLNYYRPTSLGMTGPMYQCRDVISKCNVTGHWKTYDSFIEAACLAYSTIYNFKYRNVFCYLCNTNDLSGFSYCAETPRPHEFVDFLALLRFQPEFKTSVPDLKPAMTCSKNQIFDPLKKICRDIECLFPKTIQNGNCKIFVDSIAGIEFGIYLKMTPLEEMDVDFTELHDVAEELKKEIITSINLKVKNNCIISSKIYSNMYPVVEKHSFILKQRISYFVVYVEMYCGILRSLNSDVVDKLLSFHDTVLLIGIPLYNKTISAFNIQIDLHKRETDLVPRDQFYKYVDDLYTVLSKELPSGYKRYPLIILSVPYVCPTVRITTNKVDIVESSDYVSITEYNATVDIKEVLIENLPDGNGFSVRMCTNLFEFIVKQFDVSNISSLVPLQATCSKEIFSAKTILTFVCTTASLCFSIITLLFHLKFKKVKTQPVINNIVLCFALILAQSLYQFGSGQSCIVSKLSCQVIGAFVHFSWLFLMFWMNSCCIHMFRVFILNQTQMAVFNVSKTTIVYVVYSFACSLVITSTNVIVSLFTSDGLDVGYGGTLCYISQGHMVAYLFALPVAAIVLFNIILFIRVILQMRNTSKVQIDTNRQQFFHIYAKLSTLTGCAWMFGFCSYFFTIAALDYMFIILNASQGLFLFFAFVANKHTLKSLLAKKDIDSSANRVQ